MYKLKALFFLALIIILFISCVKDNTSILDEERKLMPLNIGNSWFFVKSYYNSDLELVKAEHDTFTISSDTLISNEIWFCYNYLGHRIAYLNSQNGLSARLVSKNTPDDVYLQYKYPAKTGYSFGYPRVWFSGTEAWFDDSKEIATVICVDTTITVQAGSFKCYQYRIQKIDSDNTFIDEYIAPEYGWIKKEVYWKAENEYYISCIIELNELTIK